MTSKPIYASHQLNQKDGFTNSYHPTISSATPVYQPTSDLTGSLDNQQAAKAFYQLENRGGPSQHLIPATHGDSLHETVWAQYPFSYGGILCPLATKGTFHPTSSVIGIHGEAIQRPYEQYWHHHPLYQPKQLDQRPSIAGSVRSREP